MMNQKHAIFLFTLNQETVQPWLDAGYICWMVDLQHPVAYETSGITSEGNLRKVHADLSMPWLPPIPREWIKFVGAFPPCDHLSVAGARWFKGKGLRMLSLAVSCFATAAEFCEWSGAPYFIENPVSNISSHWRKPDHYFHPYQFTALCEGDRYTKKTCLWVGGGFAMPEPQIHPMVQKAIDHVIESCGRFVPIQKALAGSSDKELVEAWYPDDRIHKCAPGEDRSNKRSKTPTGWITATYTANHGAELAAV